MKKYIIMLLLFWKCVLQAQPVKPVQIEYLGTKYWKYESVDTSNNTPFKFYYMYDSKGQYLGWKDKFPRDGKWISFYKEDSSKVASIFEIKNGLLNGKSVQYDLEASKTSEYDFMEGEQDGFVRYWNKAGVLTLEHEYKFKDYGHFKSSIRVGVWRQWNTNGQLVKIENFIDNEPEGLQLEYYDNGQVYIKEFYKNGLRDSLLTVYHPNGQIKTQVEYNHGVFVPNNPHREYYPNGGVSGIGNLAEGRRTGNWTYFYESGMKESEGDYGTYIYNHEHGDLYFSIKIGFWRYWYESGKIKAEGTYGSGEFDNITYDPDGWGVKPIRESHWRYFDATGKEITLSEFEEQESISDY